MVTASPAAKRARQWTASAILLDRRPHERVKNGFGRPHSIGGNGNSVTAKNPHRAISPCAAGNKTLPRRIFPNQNPQRQIQGERGMRRHRGRTHLRIAENKNRPRRKRLPYRTGSGRVIDLCKNNPSHGANRHGKTIESFAYRIHARDRNDPCILGPCP